MERHAALSLLDLPEYATEAQILASAERRRAELEERLAKAPIMALKAKYRSEIERVKQAVDVLTAEVTSGSDFEDLPVGQKIDTDVHAPPSANEAPVHSTPGGRRPPERGTSSGSDKAPASEAASSRPPPRKSPPVQPSSPTQASREREGGRRPPSKAEKPRRGEMDEEPEAGELVPEDREPPPPREPMSPKVFWALITVSILLLGGAGYAVWQFWWVPGQLAQRAEAGHGALANVAGDLGAMSVEGELVHAKVRALCLAAFALGCTDHKAEASGYVNEATNLINAAPEGASRNEDQCRVIAAQAAAGNTQGAITALVTLQADREKTERKGRPAAANAAPSRTPVYEDLARRAIAIAQARQGQPEQAMRLIEGISVNNDVLACEALAEIARQFMALKNKAQALQTLQALETRAKRVPDPIRRAPMLTFVAERMHAMQGSAKARQWVNDALSGITSGSGGSSSGYADYEARKTIAQAIILPTQLRAGGEQKDGYRKKLEDVSALAANLQANVGAIKGQPDFQNRAVAYAHVAVAWHELGRRWFSGDARDRAVDAVAKAIQAAEQVRPPVQTELAEAAIDKKEEAMVAIIQALAVMADFEQARRIAQGLTLAENQGPAAEAIAYQFGVQGRMEEGQDFVRSLPGGEPRIRAAIGLNYGLNGLPLEKWW